MTMHISGVEQLQIPHAFLDIETSGLDPVKHEPIEVAYILEPEGRVVHKGLLFNVSAADPKALEVNGYGKREWPHIADRLDFARQLREDLKDRIIIGNGVWFDMDFLREFLRRHKMEPTWNYRLVCVKTMAAGALGMEPPWDKDKMKAALGLPNEPDAHTAWADAEWNREAYYAVIAFRTMNPGS